MAKLIQCKDIGNVVDDAVSNIFLSLVVLSMYF